MFQSVYKCFETNGNRHKARAWKSKRLLDESIKYCSNVKSSRLRAKLDRNCLKQEKLTFANKMWLTFIWPMK